MQHGKNRLKTALLPLALPLAVSASNAGNQHPAYLHALSDLRRAYALIEHRPGDKAVSQQEEVAKTSITKAIDDLKRASIDDGKSLKDVPAPQTTKDQSGRLHEAADLLQEARSDIGREEDDPKAKGAQQAALNDVKQALDATHKAITDVQKHT
jgi:hypothetical protein